MERGVMMDNAPKVKSLVTGDSTVLGCKRGLQQENQVPGWSLVHQWTLLLCDLPISPTHSTLLDIQLEAIPVLWMRQ